MKMRLKIYFLLLASSLAAEGVEVISKRSLVSTITEVWPSPMSGVLDRDEASMENQDIGDQGLACNSQSDFQSLSVSAASSLVFRQTNTAEATHFWIEASSGMQSQGDWVTVNTNLITKAFAAASISMELKSDKPFRYEIEASGQSPPVLPNAGGISIRSVGGQPLLELDWGSSGIGRPRSQGGFPAGIYRVEFFSNAQAEGDINSVILNPIGGTARSTVSLTVTPEEPAATPPAMLKMRLGSEDRVLLEMVKLQPGTFYFIERAEELTPGPWGIVANFIAGGTNAIYSETVNPAVRSVFYRLRY